MGTCRSLQLRIGQKKTFLRYFKANTHLQKVKVISKVKGSYKAKGFEAALIFASLCRSQKCAEKSPSALGRGAEGAEIKGPVFANTIVAVF